MMRAGLLAASVLLLSLGGCGGPVSTSDDVQSTAGLQICNVRTIALRGLWDVFSLGLNELVDKMNAVGLPAEARSGPDWPNILNEIIREDRNIPVVLVGHSYGADQAVEICEALEDRGISIQLLVLVDPTDPHPIPSNVDRCVQFYIPTPLGDSLPDVFAGSPAPPAQGNDHTQFRNILVSTETLGDQVSEADHFNLESNDLLHAIIIDEVQQLCAADGDAP